MNLYWIAHKDHTDMFSQGYIGISKNVKRRWADHKSVPSNPHLKNAIQKYGWDNLVKKVILVADDAYCLEIEQKLRPSEKIGWNLIAGGGKPPIATWNKSQKMTEETKQKLKQSLKGRTAWNKGIKLTEKQKAKQFNLAEYMKDKPHGMLGKTMPKESIEQMKSKKIGQKHKPETILKMKKYQEKVKMALTLLKEQSCQVL